MPRQTQTEKIIASVKGLRDHLQPDEQPLMSIPAIWDGGQSTHSTPCDVIVTNQRLLGYYFVKWPRERLFLEDLPLTAISSVSLRQKKHAPVFRELFVSTGQQDVYIRAPQRKIETLYTGLHSALDSYTTSDSATGPGASSDEVATEAAPVFGRLETNNAFNNSPLAITLLFTGGLILEFLGILFWTGIHRPDIGVPLLVAGIVAIITAILVRRASTL